MRKTYLLAALAAMLLSTPILPGCSPCHAAPAALTQPLPVVTPEALETMKQELDRPLLLVYWASWCIPCQVFREETLSAIAERYGEKLTMVGISVDQDHAKASAYAHRNDMPFLPLQASPELYATRRNSSIPASYLYDKEGNEVKQFTGAVSLKRVEYFVRKTLGLLPQKKP